jgi:hypothetical protein
MALRIPEAIGYLMVFMIFCELHGGECFSITTINKSSNNLGHRNAIKNLNYKIINIPNYIPISRPTGATCDMFLFSIYMYITLHVSSVKRSSSGVPHRTYSLQFLCLCLSAALSCKKVSYKTQTQKLEAVCMVRNS